VYNRGLVYNRRFWVQEGKTSGYYYTRPRGYGGSEETSICDPGDTGENKNSVMYFRYFIVYNA